MIFCTNSIDYLFRMSASEGEPAIERSSTTFAASAGPDSKGSCRPLNHIAKADVLIADETRKAHAVRLAFLLVGLTILYLFCVHSIHLLSYVVLSSWYAAQASNKGGTTVVLRCIETWVTAEFISVAVAAGNCDHKSAMAPVTK